EKHRNSNHYKCINRLILNILNFIFLDIFKQRASSNPHFKLIHWFEPAVMVLFLEFKCCAYIEYRNTITQFAISSKIVRKKTTSSGKSGYTYTTSIVFSKITVV